MARTGPDCYKCVHRRNLAGSAHSACHHPGAVAAHGDNPLLELMAIFASVGRVPPVVLASELNVRGHPHGIENGWFNWPFNFDPIWLEHCDGFEERART